MKKYMMLCMVIGSNAIAQTTQLTNSSKLPAKIKVVYNQQCDDAQYTSEYNFELPPSQTVDVTPKITAAKGKKGCDVTIDSVKATIAFPDGITEISRTWRGPFGKYINIGSGYPSNASLANEVLWLK